MLYYSLNVAEHRLEVERKRIALDIYGYLKEVCRVKHSSVVIVRELYVRFLFDYDGLGYNAEALACVVEYYVFVIESYVDDIVACIDYFINGLTFCICIRVYVFKRIFSLAVYSVHMIESVVFEIAYAAYRSFEYEYLYRLVNACAVSYLIVGVAVGKSYRTDFDIDYRAYRHTLYVLFAACGDSVFANPRTCIVLSRYRLDLYLADNIVYAVIIGYFVCSEVCVYRQRSGQYLYFDILVEVQIQSSVTRLYAALRSVYVRCRIAVNIGYAAVNCRRISAACDYCVQIGSSGISCVCVDTVGAGIYSLERADLLRSIVIECYRGTLHVLIVVILCSRISRAAVTRNRKLVALELNAAVSCHYCRKIEIVIFSVSRAQRRYRKPYRLFAFAFFEHQRRHYVLLLSGITNFSNEFGRIRSNLLCAVESYVFHSVESGISRRGENGNAGNVILFTGYPVSAGSFDKVHIRYADRTVAVAVPTNYNTYGSIFVIVHIGTDNICIDYCRIRNNNTVDIVSAVVHISHYKSRLGSVVSITASALVADSNFRRSVTCKSNAVKIDSTAFRRRYKTA